MSEPPPAQGQGALQRGEIALIGIGSNLHGPVKQVRAAIHDLAHLPGSALVAASSLYWSPPLGGLPQPPYVNAVAAVRTIRAPLALLAHLQAIERRHGRRPSRTRWASRNLDLDVLTYGDLRLDTPRLRLPHPGIPERAFVLIPIREMFGPDYRVRGLGTVSELLERCPVMALTQVTDDHASD